ncbi:myb-like domain, Myb/SANT-like DNA-binding domain protein [Artemisia annua]|uniref:Myb-like domain, Myb/SANT-like DNA-binding domain protein n=1 Tax=Artemisia annua TaxID=35608 RepID=A0A2U1LQ60_ARTAN|nr:myb-like domain, Myb/SANT-like DNA-binding domain protein [Artemisia annua]
MVPETQPFNEEAETQPINEEVEEVVVTPPKRKVNTNWSPEEEEALAKAWIKISVDKQVGDRQTKQGFWKRVLKHYQSLMPRSQRTKDQLNSKWTPMNASIVAFNGYFQQAIILCYTNPEHSYAVATSSFPAFHPVVRLWWWDTGHDHDRLDSEDLVPTMFNFRFNSVDGDTKELAYY